MDRMKIVCFFLLAFLASKGVSTQQPTKVYSMIYQDYQAEENFDYCIRLLNKTHQVGCQSSRLGNVGVLYQVEDVAALDRFLSIDKKQPKKYALLLEEKIFNKTNLLRLMNFKKVSGILVYAQRTGQETDFDWSPESPCPVNYPELYNGTYGSTYQHCSRGSKNLNPYGDSMLDVSVPFPIFYLYNEDLRDELIKCKNDHNNDDKYPYCAVEMKSFMNGAVSSVVCDRRNSYGSVLSPTRYCDAITGRNVYSSLKALTSSNSSNKSTILVIAPTDSRSFMPSSSWASNADTATGFITAMAVAQALGKLNATVKEGLAKNVVFGLLDGEAFDGIGAKQMVKDLNSIQFPFEDSPGDGVGIAMTDITNVFEISQLGLLTNDTATGNTLLYAHSDPVSKGGSNADEINRMVQSLTDQGASSSLVVREAASDLGIPPSAIQTMLRSHDIPSLLLAEYDEQFVNRHYLSRYDNLRYLINFRGNRTEEEMLTLIAPLAQKLGRVATSVARSLYELSASGTPDDSVRDSITSDENTIANLIYCFLHNSSCTYMQDFYSSSLPPILNYNGPFYDGPIPRFTSVGHNRAYIAIANFMIAFLGETKTQYSSDNCTESYRNSKNSSALYFDNNPQTKQMNSGACIVSSTFTPLAQQDTDSDDNRQWTESSWEVDAIKLRVFLVQDLLSQQLQLASGCIVFAFSLLIVYLIDRKASVLFRNGAVL